jgi:hypothetical protein
MAVGNGPLAVGKAQPSRPHGIPAKCYIDSGAGDAVDTLRCSSSKTNAVAFSSGKRHRLEVLIAASNAFVAEEQALGDVGSNEILQAFKTAPTLIETRRPGLWRQTGSANSCYPSPAGFFPPLLREGVATVRNDECAAHHVGGGTTASCDRSNSIWATSINCFFRLLILPLWPKCGSS